MNNVDTMWVLYMGWRSHVVALGVDNWVGYGDAHDDFEAITGADYWDFDIDDYLKGE